MAAGFSSKLSLILNSRKIFKNWYLYPLVYFHIIKKEYVIFETKTGLKIKIRVNSTDLMALTHVWMIKEYYDKNFKINENDNIVDVGAHIGLFALYASQYCKNGKIYCFEPIKENYNLLLENIRINKNKNIIAYNQAVTKKSSIVKIFLNKDESGHSMFIENKNFRNINSKSLSDIFAENNIEKCNFLKLDCEGTEYEIIESVKSELLEKIQKTVIEYHMADTNPELLEKLISRLKQFSFKVYTKPLFNDIGFVYGKK